MIERTWVTYWIVESNESGTILKRVSTGGEMKMREEYTALKHSRPKYRLYEMECRVKSELLVSTP